MKSKEVSSSLRSVELFAGAGGLALGLTLAGFKHSAVIEWDHDSCETIRENQRRGFNLVKDWIVYEQDASKFQYSDITEKIDLVSGGPPCQPFSLAGKHGAFNDNRDMWGEAVRAVRELGPQAFIFENVKGLLRPAFKIYFQYILDQLAHPSILRKKNEDWSRHASRLIELKLVKNPEYSVHFKLLNAADYGVAQKRERVVIVGFKYNSGIKWEFPVPTHSQKWVTIRKAIADLPEISASRPTSEVSNHSFQKGAKFYKGHTGSKLDEPGKTLKAGAHGVPGGENMIVNDDGTCRYFSVREAARLQCFPDGYIFPGSWSENMRQLGNAVPVLLAKTIGESVWEALKRETLCDTQDAPAIYEQARELQST